MIEAMWRAVAFRVRCGSNFSRGDCLSSRRRNCDSQLVEQELPPLLRMRTCCEAMRWRRVNVQRADVSELVQRSTCEVLALISDQL